MRFLLLCICYIIFWGHVQNASATPTEQGTVGLHALQLDQFHDDKRKFDLINKFFGKDISLYKVLVPDDEWAENDDKTVFNDYVLVFSTNKLNNSHVSSEKFELFKREFDNAFSGITKINHDYTRKDNLQLLERLNKGKNKYFILEKDLTSRSVTYISIAEKNSNGFYTINGMSCVLLGNRIVVLFSCSRIRGNAIYGSVKKVRSMTSKVISGVVQFEQ